VLIRKLQWHSNKVADRLSAGIRRFQPVLTAAKSRDVNESDTAIIVTDMLADVFGYDKYSDDHVRVL